MSKLLITSLTNQGQQPLIQVDHSQFIVLQECLLQVHLFQECNQLLTEVVIRVNQARMLQLQVVMALNQVPIHLLLMVVNQAGLLSLPPMVNPLVAGAACLLPEATLQPLSATIQEPHLQAIVLATHQAQATTTLVDHSYLI